MQQSNTYVIIFSAILTIVLGGLLSVTSVVLKPRQDKQVELDTKKKILGAVMDVSAIEEPDAILALYKERISSMVVDYQGNQLLVDAKGDSLVAEEINIQKNYKVDPKERMYPVFMFKNEQGEVDGYVFPTFGAGLWDWISSFVALEKDLNTIKGIAFDHKQETPGLGARITDAVVQDRFKGTKIFEDGQLVSVRMLKGEGNSGLGDHQVDGLSGATMTANGVNDMLSHYFECYMPFIDKIKASGKVALAN
ncbi:MAG: NADH:ubiquinone reductase (Na(+)-transporting) subunit C [Bacteroidota bacterium]